MVWEIVAAGLGTRGVVTCDCNDTEANKENNTDTSLSDVSFVIINILNAKAS